MFFDIRQNEESARNYTTTILKRKNEGISKMADNRVIIFDTTLRDGEQALPQSLSMRQKLQIALALEELGVDVIEAGFPISSQGDFESVQTIAQTLKRSIPCGLSRAILKDVECAGEALKVAEHFRIHTFIATSSIHVKDKLRKSFDDVLAMGVAAVKCARQYTDDVEFSCEDAGRTPIDQLCRMVEEAIEAGATTINIPDTVGYTVPMEFGGIISQILNRVPNIDKAVLSVHCHNDLGMATANSLTAVQMGARQIECCMNGLGERAGNAPLASVQAILKDQFNAQTDIDESRLNEVSRMVESYSGIPIPPNRPITGESVFTQVAGVHADGDNKANLYCNDLLPERFGRKREYALGKNSGKANILKNLEELGLELSPEQTRKVTERIIELGDKKELVTQEDLPYIVSDVLKHGAVGEKVKLKSYFVNLAHGLKPMATLKIEINGKEYEESSSGDGQYDAFVRALRKIYKVTLGRKFPMLTNYAVTIPPGGRTDAFVQTVITWSYDEQVFRTRGLDADQTEAAIKATMKMLNLIEDEYEKSK